MRLAVFTSVCLCIILVGLGVILIHDSYQNRPSDDAVKALAVDIGRGDSTPSEPTTNPSDPYNPLPLRVGTVGSRTYHRPFCPYAKKALDKYGVKNRINYWTREQVAIHGCYPDPYCMADIFDCDDLTPDVFVQSVNDPWCGANIRRDRFKVAGIDDIISNKVLCNIQGYIGTFVNHPADCINGKIKGSSKECDQLACSNCKSDCELICNGCVMVTLAPINKLRIGLGDANRDGEEDVNDYLFFHKCYSGSDVADVFCQNVFDFDQDGDVDVDDFNQFVMSYNSGNVTWALENYPDAVVSSLDLEIPLRIGIEGSNYYHRIDCPVAKAFIEANGIDKRIDFYSWDQIERTQYIPDDGCLAGTRQNPSGSLQNCQLDDDQDGVLNCEDECPEDKDKVVYGICGCGIPDNDLNQDGIVDCLQ